MYDEKYVKGNCAALFIYRMVYAEVKLHKVVDWSTILVKEWTEADIPNYRKYPEGGLGRSIKNLKTPAVARQLAMSTSTSSTDSNSDGCRGAKARRKPGRQLKVLRLLPERRWREDVEQRLLFVRWMEPMQMFLFRRMWNRSIFRRK